MLRFLSCSFIIVLVHLIRTINMQVSCVYDIDTSQQLDVRTLGIDNGRGPKYDQIQVTSPVPYIFSWNGCFAYKKSDGGNCDDAAACFSE
jgi:hypothetical protein